MTAIPRLELDTLIFTVAEATDLATEGLVGDGYTALLAGRQRVRELALEEPPWLAELEARWEEAVERYAARWVVGRG